MAGNPFDALAMNEPGPTPLFLLCPCFAQNEAVVHDVMASDWSSASPALQRLVYIIVMRATKPPALWCWRVFRVGLTTWLQVCRETEMELALH